MNANIIPVYEEIIETIVNMHDHGIKIVPDQSRTITDLLSFHAPDIGEALSRVVYHYADLPETALVMRELLDKLQILGDVDFLDVVKDPEVAKLGGFIKHENGEKEIETIINGPSLFVAKDMQPNGTPEPAGKTPRDISSLFASAHESKTRTPVLPTMAPTGEVTAVVLRADLSTGGPVFEVISSTHTAFLPGARVSGELLIFMASTGKIVITVIPV